MAEQIVAKYPNPFNCMCTSPINIITYHHCVLLLLEATIAKAVAVHDYDYYYWIHTNIRAMGSGLGHVVLHWGRALHKCYWNVNITVDGFGYTHFLHNQVWLLQTHSRLSNDHGS